MVAVFGWLRKNREQPLGASPARARVKTYSADSGHVYQYVFLGQRRQTAATEYVFSVSHQRQANQRVIVSVADSCTEGLDLNGSMRYAVAKIALRRAMDQRAPTGLTEPIAPDAALVGEIVAELGL